MPSIWEGIAAKYDSVITNTRNTYLQQIMKEEQDLLETTIRDAASSGRKISVIEVGSGTGRSLFACARNNKLRHHIEYLIGIDDAAAMCAIAKHERDFRHAGRDISNELADRILFFHLGGQGLSRFFYNGHILKRNLNPKVDWFEMPRFRALNAEVYCLSAKVVCNMFNTLGVMRISIRRSVVQNMLLAVQPGDKVVISVLDGECFGEQARRLYRDLKPVVGKFDESALNDKTREFRTTTYYSHWFKRDEIESFILEVARSLDMAVDVRVVPLPAGGYFATCVMLESRN